MSPSMPATTIQPHFSGPSVSTSDHPHPLGVKRLQKNGPSHSSAEKTLSVRKIARSAMCSIIITKPGFKIIGIEVRTRNPDEMSGKGKIGEIWHKFYSENILSKIPGKRGDAVLAAYTDYESDVNGAY